MDKFFKKNSLIFLIFIGIFFRTYQLVNRFEFAHDGDLYSWIVKDILINHHLRLIGQLTSAPGIFIGPLFYYLLTPFFLITKLDPIGAIIPALLLSVATMLSFYVVFSKLFNQQMALLATFLQASLPAAVSFDRWVVPTNTISIWMVWYFYTVISISRGNLNVFALLGVLVGLIWHIHIALVPSLLAVPAAILLSKKLPNKKQLLFFLLGFVIISLPLILFETRHNFSQTLSFISNLQLSQGSFSPLAKINLIWLYLVGNISTLLLPNQLSNLIDHKIFAVGLFLSAPFLIYKKVLPLRDSLVWLTWAAGTTLFFGLSSAPISEYYFKSLDIIFMTLMVLLLYFIFKISKITQAMVLVFLAVFLIFNTVNFLNLYVYPKGYVQRKTVARFITEDSISKNYPCVAISYITSPGENVGFRYFFWLDNLKTRPISTSVPIYTIVIPDELAKDRVKIKFGKIGVIPPQKIIPENELAKNCQGENSNLTDPMFGYTQ